MKFLSVEVANFLIISSAKVELADRGLLLIQGQNDDDTSATSNGAGKSSLVDAISWCLYGITARGVSGDDVINNKVGKGTFARVTLKEGDDTYVVTRHRKHSTFKNSLVVLRQLVSGVSSDLTRGTDKLTQELVDKIVGCSHEVFKAAIYAGQEQMPDLPAMTDKSLKMLIEEAAGTEILEAAYKEANTRRATILSKVEETKGVIASLTDALKTLIENVGETEHDIVRWTTGQKLLIDEERAKLGPLATSARELRAEIHDRNKPALVALLASEKAKIDAIDGERVVERDLIEEVSNADGHKRMLGANLASISNEIDRERRGIEKMKEKIGTPCPTCGKGFCEHDIEDARRLAAERVDALTHKRDALASQLEDARRSHESVTERLEKHRASMTDISATSAKIDAINSVIGEIQEKEHTLGKQIERIAEIKKRIEIEVKKNHPYESHLNRLRSAIEDKNTQIADKEAVLDENKRKLDVATLAARVFSPAGVRAHILDTVTPFLNDQTAKYLGTLSDGRISATWTTLVKNAKGELREKFAIEVTKDNASKSFAGLSGGEKRKVRIACALALQDLVATRATKPIDLFVADEIDQALDTAGLERLTSVLEEKAKERGTVIVISHNSLRDWISQVLTVKNVDGLSTVEEEIV